jgi:outer membrane protein assembly factor BamB
VSGVVYQTHNSVPTIYLIDAHKNHLVILDGLSGRIRKQETLRERPHGTPALLPGTGLLIPTDKSIELRSLDGLYIRTIDLTSELTTSLLVARVSNSTVLIMGTKNGLAIFDPGTFKEVARVPIEGDYPVGSLVATDIDSANPAVLTSTHSGRVVAINLASGSLKWLSPIVTHPLVTFDVADLNGDGQSDILVPGLKQFALALSGKDGSVIWDSESTKTESGGPAMLVFTRTFDGRMLVTVSEPGGLRTVELPRLSAGKN